jgi:phosphate transport system substrate-binding protein
VLPPIGTADETAMRVVQTLPVYIPTTNVTGRIRLWGHGSFKHDFMRALIDSWIAQFNRYQPDVTFEYRMYGTASAVGAIYTGAGDIAILGEEISPAAARAFKRAKGYPPTEISIATGSVDANFFDYAHMIFVHADNPIDRLSLTELDAIFGAEHRRAGRNIRRWGELGLTGEWADKRIRPYGWKTDVDFALFFRERVLGGSHRWNPDIEEYVHGTRGDGTQYDQGQRIIDALANDRHGIAISNVRYATPSVKPLALAWQPTGPYVDPTPANLISQAYPLVRIIPAIIDRAPDRSVEPRIREFLRFVLSREGQAALLEKSGYLPLGPKIAEAQLDKLR